MSSWSYDPVRADLAAYALGVLEPADDVAVRAHLETCGECQAELAEFTALVPRLAAVADSELTLPQLPADLFDRVVAAVDASAVPTSIDPVREVSTGSTRVRRLRRAHRGGRWWLAAAAVLVIALIGGATLTAHRLQRTDSVSAVATSGAITMHVTAIDAASGSTLRIRVDGVPQNIRCHLVVTKDDGSRRIAGWWSSDYSGHAVFTFPTDVRRDRLAVLTLYDAQDRNLVSLHM